MRALYDIDADIMACVDEETGEINVSRLNELNKERNRKVEVVALWCVSLNADISAYRAEEKRFQAKRESAESTLKSLKNWLIYALNGEKYHSTKVDVTFRKSKQLVISEDAFIPPTYTKIHKSVDKAKLKKDILDGLEVKGCEVIENVNTQVK